MEKLTRNTTVNFGIDLEFLSSSLDLLRKRFRKFLWRRQGQQICLKKDWNAQRKKLNDEILVRVLL